MASPDASGILGGGEWFMKSKTKIGVPASIALLAALLASAVPVHAQAVSRFLGTVTAISGDTLTVKTDAGEVHAGRFPSTAVLKQIAPGEKDLSKAGNPFGGLATGDRVLVGWIPTHRRAQRRRCRSLPSSGGPGQEADSSSAKTGNSMA